MRFRKGSRAGTCSVCGHIEIARIDFLLAQGAGFAPVARQFKLSDDAVRRHFRVHVSADFKARIKLGPFRSEEHLRQLCAESGRSVIDNLRAAHAGIAARWLVAFESGADATLCLLSQQLHQNLGLQARLTRELMPAPSAITNNFFCTPIFADLQNTLIRVLAEHPAARAAVIREFKNIEQRAAPSLIEAPTHDAAAA